MGYRARRQRAGIFIQQQPGIVGRDGVAAWRRLDRDLRGVHDAGRRDQADDERAVEHWRQSDGDDLTGRDRMLSPLIVAISALPRRADIGGAVDQVRFVPGAVVD